MSWENIIIALIIELIRRKAGEETAAKIAPIVKSKDPKAALEAMAETPEVQKSIVDVLADLIVGAGEAGGGILSGLFSLFDDKKV